METAVTNASGGGSGNGGSTESTVISKDDEQHNNNSNIEEVSDESELELGLGLSLGGGCGKNQTIFTAKHKHKHTDKDIHIDLPSPPSASSSSSSTLAFKPSPSSVGIKRPASPTSLSQVVGWPPIRVSRMNSMANQVKSVATGENNSELNDIKRKDVIHGTNEKGNAKSKERVPAKSSLFVKVNMDGAAIGRKVDLNAHPSYESLARTLEDMFTNTSVETESSGEELILMPKVTRPSKFLDGSSDYVLTYEDKDGDWMLVGDVPWGMFLSSVKRLRIMRSSEANGLAPRSEERSAKQRSRPI